MSDYAMQQAIARKMLTREDVLFLKRIIQETDPDHVIDLGVGGGTTALAVMDYADENCTVASFDIDETNLHWAKVAMQNYGLGHRWIGTKMDSGLAAALYPRNSIELVLLDTSHEYLPTVVELIAWRSRLVKPYPVLVGEPHDLASLWAHDYVGDYPGVTKAIDEAVAAGDWKIEAQEGLGIWLRPVWR